MRSVIAPLRRLLLIGIAAGCVFTVIGFFGRSWWFFELASHFRAQYAGGLLIAACLALFADKRVWACAALVFAIVNTAAVAPIYLEKPPFGAGPANFRILQFNVNRENDAYERVEAFIGASDANAVVLEEVTHPWTKVVRNVAGYPHFRILTRADNFGMALMSKTPLREPTVAMPKGVDKPTMSTVVNVDGKRVRIIGTHPPPPLDERFREERNEMFRMLVGMMSKSREPVILVGDLNLTPWSPIFTDFLASTGLLDSRQGYGVQPTWPTFFPWPLRIPIDHCLVSRGITVVGRKLGPPFGSDHRPVIVDLKVQ